MPTGLYSKYGVTSTRGMLPTRMHVPECAGLHGDLSKAMKDGKPVIIEVSLVVMDLLIRYFRLAFSASFIVASLGNELKWCTRGEYFS
jgi:hypothetical protein